MMEGIFYMQWVQQAVDFLNSLIMDYLPSYPGIAVALMSVGLGYLLSSDKEPKTPYWALFCIMVYMSLKYLGVGNV